jgi:hypothetical protein
VSSTPRPGSLASLVHAWTRFWFAPQSPFGFHLIRFLFGALAVYWLLSFSGHFHEFFGYAGWFDRTAYVEAGNMIDQQSWSLLYLVADNPGLLTAFYWASVAALALYALGFFTRITSVLAWLIIVSFSANPLIEIDTDVFMRLISFYLMVGYLLIDWEREDLNKLEKTVTPWHHWIGKITSTLPAEPASSAATVALRLLQVHFALAIVIMGLHKLQMMEWWSGVSLWYPLHRPAETTLESLNELRQQPVRYLVCLSLATYAVLVWQIFFPTFAWRRGVSRWLLLGGAVAGMLGLMFIYGIPLLGPVFVLLCVTYLHEEDWDRLASWFSRARSGN